MSTLPPGVTQADIDKYEKVDKAMKKLEPEKKRLSAIIKNAFTNVGNFQVGKVVIERSNANKIDLKAAEKELPFELHAENYKTVHVIDPDTLTEKQKAMFSMVIERLSIKSLD